MKPERAMSWGMRFCSFSTCMAQHGVGSTGQFQSQYAPDAIFQGHIAEHHQFLLSMGSVNDVKVS